MDKAGFVKEVMGFVLRSIEVFGAASGSAMTEEVRDRLMDKAEKLVGYAFMSGVLLRECEFVALAMDFDLLVVGLLEESTPEITEEIVDTVVADAQALIFAANKVLKQDAMGVEDFLQYLRLDSPGTGVAEDVINELVEAWDKMKRSVEG